jgi:tetratricopeptide (TPR) repeat protein
VTLNHLFLTPRRNLLMKIKKRQCTIYLCLFFIIVLGEMRGLPGFTQSSEKEPQINVEIPLNKARELRAANNNASAISLLNDILRNQPKDSSSYYERGLNYFDLKEYEKALEDFNRSINFYPESSIDSKPDIAEMFYRRGIANYEWALSQNLSRENFDNKMKASIEDVRLSIERNPTRSLDLLRKQIRPTNVEILKQEYPSAAYKCRSFKDPDELIKLARKLNLSRYEEQKEINVCIQKNSKKISTSNQSTNEQLDKYIQDITKFIGSNCPCSTETSNIEPKL